MKLYKSIALFLAFMPCFYFAVAQNNDGKISGQIKDQFNKPVTGVSVYLLRSADSALVKFTMLDKEGFFHFYDVAYGGYIINITGVGLKKTVTRPYQVGSATPVDVGTLQVMPLPGSLKQVDIVSQKPFMEIKPGKTILNIAGSSFAIGSNALDILQRAGVRVGMDETLTLNGNAGVLVLIDGRQTYLPAEALVNLLQGTQSGTINQIEIINNPGAVYDAASAGGVINIKLKKNESYGITGSINQFVGITEVNNGHGAEFGENSGITFNSRSKKLDVFGSYSFNYLPVNRVVATDRQVGYNNMLTNVYNDYFTDQKKHIGNYRIGADYNLSPAQIIGFFVSGSTTSFILNKNTSTTLSNNNVNDSTVSTIAKVNSSASNVAYDVNYKVTFKKAGDLSLDAEYATYDRTPTETINSNYYYSTNNQLYRTLTIQNDFPSNYKIYSYNADYNNDLNPTSNLRAIIKSSYVETYNNLNFGEIVGGQYQPNANFTNQFNYTERINAAALTYTKAFSKKVNLIAGVRAEQTISDGVSTTMHTEEKKDYTDFFPNVQINDKYDNNNQLQMSYNRAVTRPYYADLNPFIAYQDQYSYYIGNPYLQPFYTDLIQVSDLYKSNFKVELSFRETRNFTQVIYIQDDTTKVIYSKKVNLGDRYTTTIALTDKVHIAGWWNADLKLVAYADKFSSTPAQGSLNTNATDMDAQINQYFLLPGNFKAVSYFEYETPTTYGIFQYKSSVLTDATISKSLGKYADVAFKVSDIFNSHKDRFSSHYQNLNVSVVDQRSFRVISLSFSYKFGSKTAKGERVRKTGAETEQSRTVASP